jgi:glutaredoxin 3
MKYLIRSLLALALCFFSASASVTTMVSSAEEFAKQEISNNKVVVFSKSYCPYCRRTKALFEELGIEAKIHELNEIENGHEIQDALFKMTGQRTVPSVFIGGQHIGGSDKTMELHGSGKLLEILGNDEL